MNVARGKSACAGELRAKVAACTANMTTVYCKKNRITGHKVRYHHDS